MEHAENDEAERRHAGHRGRPGDERDEREGQHERREREEVAGRGLAGGQQRVDERPARGREQGDEDDWRPAERVERREVRREQDGDEADGGDAREGERRGGEAPARQRVSVDAGRAGDGSDGSHTDRLRAPRR
ncbi:hypothetical protein [Halosegnis marinus]|uniref:hypothetical protein n=1 Tax=Halosegnis marinus TaxID=3034023 RepID=UPI0036194E67